MGLIIGVILLIAIIIVSVTVPILKKQKKVDHDNRYDNPPKAEPLDTIEVKKQAEIISGLPSSLDESEHLDHAVAVNDFDFDIMKLDQDALNYDKRRVEVNRLNRVKDPDFTFVSSLKNELGYTDEEQIRVQAERFSKYWPTRINKYGVLDYWAVYDAFIGAFPIVEYRNADYSQGKNIAIVEEEIIEDPIIESVVANEIIEENEVEEVFDIIQRQEDVPTIEQTFSDTSDEISQERVEEVVAKIEDDYEYLLPKISNMMGDTFVKQKRAFGEEVADFAEGILEQIETFISNINFAAEVESYIVGPQIILYQVRVKTSQNRPEQIAEYRTSLEKFLKIQEVRIALALPGSDLIGIEVPHGHRFNVTFKETMLGAIPRFAKNTIVVPIGLDELGKYRYLNLDEANNILVVGNPNSGKSEFLKTILCSVVMQFKLNEIDATFFDYTGFIFNKFAKHDIVKARIVSNSQNAKAMIDRIYDEMVSRQSIMQDAHTTSFENYNNTLKKDNKELLKRIFIFIGEMADLKEFEPQLEQMISNARYVGIHFIIAGINQDAISERIKSSITCRIVFELESPDDSSKLLKNDGAIHLLGKGDALFTVNSGKSLIRVQTPYINNSNLVKLVNQLVVRRNENGGPLIDNEQDEEE